MQICHSRIFFLNLIKRLLWTLITYFSNGPLISTFLIIFYIKDVSLFRCINISENMVSHVKVSLMQRSSSCSELYFSFIIVFIAEQEGQSCNRDCTGDRLSIFVITTTFPLNWSLSKADVNNSFGSRFYHLSCASRLTLLVRNETHLLIALNSESSESQTRTPFCD